MAKGESQNRGNKNSKRGKFSERFLPPDTFEKFGLLCILDTSVLRVALLPYYRRSDNTSGTYSSFDDWLEIIAESILIVPSGGVLYLYLDMLLFLIKIY